MASATWYNICSTWDTSSNKDMYKLGKHAWCQNVLKNRLNLIAWRMKKAAKRQHEDEVVKFVKQWPEFLEWCPSISKVLSYLLPFFSWHKRIQQTLIHADDYKGVALRVISNTSCIYMKMQTYLEKLHRLACKTVQHSPNLL